MILRGDRMKREGFTLIELLAVIAILGVIAVITTPIITTSISTSKQKAYERQKGLIEKAAETYMSEKVTYNKKAICVQKLINEGYLDENIKSPSSNENMKNGCVKTTLSGKNYTYEYVASCPSSIASGDRDC